MDLATRLTAVVDNLLVEADLADEAACEAAFMRVRAVTIPVVAKVRQDKGVDAAEALRLVIERAIDAHRPKPALEDKPVAAPDTPARALHDVSDQPVAAPCLTPPVGTTAAPEPGRARARSFLGGFLGGLVAGALAGSLIAYALILPRDGSLAIALAPDEAARAGAVAQAALAAMHRVEEALKDGETAATDIAGFTPLNLAFPALYAEIAEENRTRFFIMVRRQGDRYKVLVNSSVCPLVVADDPALLDPVRSWSPILCSAFGVWSEGGESF